jgi:hypothetical protein
VNCQLTRGLSVLPLKLRLASPIQRRFVETQQGVELEFFMRGGYAVSLLLLLAGYLAGCTTIKRSDTARTGLEQMLVSSAVDRALDRVDWSPIRGAPVFVETKYLDCVDKNYVIIGVHQRLLAAGCTLVEKAEDSAVTMELGSGAVGTDRQESFLGIPEISMPASQVAIPKFAIFTREKSHGTAKIAVLAYDTKSKLPVISSGTLARSDHANWSLLGAGPVISGSVPTEVYAATRESDWMTIDQAAIAARTSKTFR